MKERKNKTGSIIEALILLPLIGVSAYFGLNKFDKWLDKKIALQQEEERFIAAWNYITPPENQSREYLLEDGTRVSVSYNYKKVVFGPSEHELEIMVDDDTKFISFEYGEKNFGELNRLYLWNEDVGVWDYLSWRNRTWDERYKDMIFRTYGEKKKLESGALSKLEKICEKD